MLNQSVSRLGKNQPIILGGKISQILIIINKAIQTARQNKEYVRYECTARYYKRHIQQKCTKKQLVENSEI